MTFPLLENASAPDPLGRTLIGREELFTVPFPRLPAKPPAPPQHHTEPPSMAHVVLPPAATLDTAVLVKPSLLETSTGTHESLSVPLPMERALPQQKTVPVVALGDEPWIAQV